MGFWHNWGKSGDKVPTPKTSALYYLQLMLNKEGVLTKRKKGF